MADMEAMSRRDFLKTFPKYLAQGVHSLGQECLESRDEKNTVNIAGKKVALVDIERCLAWVGASCQFCYLACPLREKAIVMHDLKPVIDASACDGCAKCVVACQTVNHLPAIKIVDVKENIIRKESVHV